MVYVIYDRDTKEVMAVVGEITNHIIRNDVEVKMYRDTEPVFEDIDGKIYIKENAIIIDPNI